MRRTIGGRPGLLTARQEGHLLAPGSGVAILAGTVQALIEVQSVKGLVSSSYGQLILVKIGLAAVVIGVAAYSRKLVRARTAESAPGSLRRMVFVELGITAVVLGVTAALVQIPPPRTAQAAETATTPTTVTQTVADQSHRTRMLTLKLRPKPTNSVAEHRRIAAAIREGNAAGAHDCARRHRVRARDELIPLLIESGIRHL